MLVRFYIDPETELPHIDQHDVTPTEVLEVLRGPADHGPGKDGTRIAESQIHSGRYLRVIYREIDDSVLVITAYDLGAKARAAFRRRRRRKSR